MKLTTLLRWPATEKRTDVSFALLVVEESLTGGTVGGSVVVVVGGGGISLFLYDNREVENFLSLYIHTRTHLLKCTISNTEIVSHDLSTAFLFAYKS